MYGAPRTRTFIIQNERRVIVAFFLIFWGCITFMVVREYIKMSAEDRKSARDDFKTPNFIFTIGFLVVGCFLATMGNAFTFGSINIVGIVFFGIGGVVSFITMWKESKMKSFYILSLTILAAYLFS